MLSVIRKNGTQMPATTEVEAENARNRLAEMKGSNLSTIGCHGEEINKPQSLTTCFATRLKERLASGPRRKQLVTFGHCGSEP